MIRPLHNRVLVKLIPRYQGDENKLGLVLVDKQHHFDGVRRGEVVGVGFGVRDVVVGDVLWFRGDSGTSFGHDALGTNDGTDFRSLSPSEMLAVEEKP